MAVEGSALERGKPDPDVVLPAAVRRASERANELAQQAKEAKAANPEADKPLRVIAPAPTINSSGVQVTNYDPNNPAPPPEPAPPANLEGQPQPQLAPPDIEHQFKSLQGRYSKADEENRRMAQQVADLQRLLATVQTPPPALQSPPAQAGSGVRFTGPVAQPRVTPKEVEEFGKEFIDVVGRRAMEVQEATLQPTLSRLEQKIQQLEGQLGGVRQVQVTDANERMWNILDREVPNWQGINGSSEFVQWLQVPDPLSGQIRHGLLEEAFRNQQVGRVIEFFRRFLSDYAQVAPQPLPQPQLQLPRPNGGGASVNLMELAAPGRAKTGQTNLAPDKPTYTTAEISQFYHDKTFGKYKGREAEMNALENDIFTAQREGRIRKP
jgi:hypothetical protein